MISQAIREHQLILSCSEYSILLGNEEIVVVNFLQNPDGHLSLRIAVVFSCCADEEIQSASLAIASCLIHYFAAITFNHSTRWRTLCKQFITLNASEHFYHTPKLGLCRFLCIARARAHTVSSCNPTGAEYFVPVLVYSYSKSSSS